MQQHLPFTVLKQYHIGSFNPDSMLQQHLPFTVLKQQHLSLRNMASSKRVATALTVYGIETKNAVIVAKAVFLLQQHLPFTVLKQHLS